MATELLRMKGISKSFGGIAAVKDVDLRLEAGEVLGLVGANGAGKSTLMKILSGIVPADRGAITLSGATLTLESPVHAQSLGIAMIPQELLLVPELTVVENLFLGHELRGRCGFLRKKAMRTEARKILDGIDGSHIGLDALISALPKADQQIVAIARRLHQEGRVFIMDEPTASLTSKETESLFRVIRKLKASGHSTIYISHRLEEDLEICDRFTVMKDGQVVADFPNGPSVDKQDLVRGMIGETMGEEFPHTAARRGEELLRVEGLSYATYQGVFVKDLSFSVHRGEVVGITGLVGVGKTELGQCLMGLRKRVAGATFIEGRKAPLSSAKEAVRRGFGYVSEDRRDEGLVLAMESRHNMTLGCLGKISTAAVLSTSREKKLTEGYLERLGMKPQYLGMEVRQLSGGNQQKVVILRQILGDSQIVIFDEPTKGIDVKAKSEVSTIIGELSKEGKAVLILSSEPGEVLGISDTVFVLAGGGLRGPYPRGALSYPELMDIEFGQATAEPRGGR